MAQSATKCSLIKNRLYRTIFFSAFASTRKIQLSNKITSRMRYANETKEALNCPDINPVADKSSSRSCKSDPINRHHTAKKPSGDPDEMGPGTPERS